MHFLLAIQVQTIEWKDRLFTAASPIENRERVAEGVRNVEHLCHTGHDVDFFSSGPCGRHVVRRTPPLMDSVRNRTEED